MQPGDIRTTNGDIFTMAQTADLARLVWRRFGEDLEAATAAWNRMLQTDITSGYFRKLIDWEPWEGERT